MQNDFSTMMSSINKYQIATFIALLFHVSGCIGMFTQHRDWFVQNTPLNLLIVFIMVIWTHRPKNKSFLVFLLVCFVMGMVAEIIGTKTSLLFGSYHYGEVMGTKIAQVPLLIGVNWFVIMYASGMVVQKIHDWVEGKYVTAGSMMSPQVKRLSIIIDGALLATFFDYIMEPVAIKLGYWTWHGDGAVPFTNYLAWFVISTLLLYFFTKMPVQRHNQFAVHLFFIQLLFFGVLRTFL